GGARSQGGGAAEEPAGLEQPPPRVKARSGARGERLLRRLDARFHADDVADFLLQLRVELDQEIHRAGRLARNVGQIFRKQRPGIAGREIWRKFGLEIVGIGERKTVGVRLDKEIERIDTGHLRSEIDFELELDSLL